MLFNSLHFLLFFPILLILYKILSEKHRWILILIASLYFYGCWNPFYLPLLLFAASIDYFAAIWIEKTSEPSKRRIILAVSMISNLSILFYFKYANFFIENTTLFLHSLSISVNPTYLNVILPAGISFYTFQSMSYTIDVYKGEAKPETSFARFILYICYFPQLVAGPIERCTRLMPQLHNFKPITIERMSSGIQLIVFGLFKKMVIADRAALFADQVFNHPKDYQGLSILIATYCFAFQIFCDFSGYSDIAMGCSKILGVDLMVNFNRPYASRSISEFWRRWHISLSTWFRDYVYIPLGGSQLGQMKFYRNLFVVFLLSGFWHGASWTFIAWGALHVSYMIFGDLFKKSISLKISFQNFIPQNVLNFAKVIFVFHLTCFAWMFFRANSLQDAFLSIKNMFQFENIPLHVLATGPGEFVILLVAIIMMEIFQLPNNSILNINHNTYLNFRRSYIFSVAFSFLIVSFMFYSQRQFIYFQF